MAISETGLTLQVNVDDEDVQLMLARFATAISPESINIWLETFGPQWFQHRAQERFDSEGDAASGAWAPLLQATKDARRHGIERGEYSGISEDHPINQRTHEMINFLTHADGNISGLDRFSWPEPAEGNVVTKIAYAQTGGGHGGIERPVIAYDETDELAFVFSLEEHIEAFLGGGGF